MPIIKQENLNEDQILIEKLHNGFRTQAGLSLSNFDKIHNSKSIISKLVQDGYLLIENKTLKPTLKGMLIADSLVLQFIN